MLWAYIHTHTHTYIHAVYGHIPVALDLNPITTKHVMVVHTYTHTYTHTYIHTHIHTHTHTYIHAVYGHIPVALDLNPITGKHVMVALKDVMMYSWIIHFVFHILFMWYADMEVRRSLLRNRLHFYLEVCMCVCVCVCVCV